MKITKDTIIKPVTNTKLHVLKSLHFAMNTKIYNCSFSSFNLHSNPV